MPLLWDYRTGKARSERAYCEDGRMRTALVTGEPDTFFSCPGRVNVYDRERHETVTVSGLLFFGSDWEEHPITFSASRRGRHWGLLNRKEAGLDTTPDDSDRAWVVWALDELLVQGQRVSITRTYRVRFYPLLQALERAAPGVTLLAPNSEQPDKTDIDTSDAAGRRYRYWWERGYRVDDPELGLVSQP
jgi:hypothetical protein